MTDFVEIAVNIPQVTGLFDYHLPDWLEGKVRQGHLVIVPFGRQTVQGVVVRLIPKASVIETKAVLDLVDPEPVVTPSQISLAHYLAESTLAPLAACLDLMLPPGLFQQADTLYRLQTALPLSADGDQPVLGEVQKRIINLLSRRGPLRGQQIDHALGRVEWRGSLRGLVKRGLVSSQSILPPPAVHPKTVRTARLACSPEQAARALPDLARSGSQALTRRQAALRCLMREGGPLEVAWVYAESGANLQDLYALAERGLVGLGESEIWRDPLAQLDLPPGEPPTLTSGQQEIWEQIQTCLLAAAAGQPQAPLLLHGVTGSGKTEIYLQAVAEVLRHQRQAIILVPEIALTPQTVRRFASRFPGQVGLVHSRLSSGERYDTWRRARSGELPVLVGPRSALFSPVPDLGLVVVDECHDESYYQSDPQPRYHTRQAAVGYARLAGAVCVLGSATPEITSVYQARRGKMVYVRLPERILAHRQVVQAQVEREHLSGSRYRPLVGDAETIDLPPVEVVDMRQELQSGNRSMFSRSLQAELQRVLEQGQQAILFLNRRGTATYVFCRDCGSALNCPRCDLPLTYHLDAPHNRDQLRCHRCGYVRKLPPACPTCSSRAIRHYGAGTERVEADLQAMFPQARLLRWDYETTRRKGAHELILSHFAAHRADILIGTQMIAKGLDLPLVTLVGAVLADVGLNLPDYRAGERTFQVLTQVAGRAGRSPLGGKVILQTFQPEHYVIQAAAGHDFEAFYQREIEYRRRLNYPPFSNLARLVIQHSNSAQAEQAALSMAANLNAWLAEEKRQATDLIGPAPCFYQRLGGMYRWQIVLRGPNPAAFLAGKTLGEWKVEVNPVNLL